MEMEELLARQQEIPAQIPQTNTSGGNAPSRRSSPAVRDIGIGEQLQSDKELAELLEYGKQLETAPGENLVEEDKKLALGAALWDTIKGFAKGPAQFVQQVKETTSDIVDGDKPADPAAYARYGTTPVEQTASAIGAYASSVGMGAAVGTAIFPGVGTAIGAAAGGFFGAFVASPTDGNVVDFARELGVPIADKINEYTYKSGDTALEARMKNLSVEAWTEVATAGTAKVLFNRHTAKAANKVITVIKAGPQI
jgi:hypothetical protein